MGTKMVGSVIFSQIMQSVDHNIYARHSTIHDICNDYDDDMDVFPSVAEPQRPGRRVKCIRQI